MDTKEIKTCGNCRWGVTFKDAENMRVCMMICAPMRADTDASECMAWIGDVKDETNAQ